MFCIVSGSKQLFSNSIGKQSLYKYLHIICFIFSFVCVNVHILEMEITILLLPNVPGHASNLYVACSQSYSSWPQIHAQVAARAATHSAWLAIRHFIASFDMHAGQALTGARGVRECVLQCRAMLWVLAPFWTIKCKFL